MALMYTPDTTEALNCPDFNLIGMDNKKHELSDFKDKKALVFMFICNHCPYVEAIEDRYIKLANEMTPKEIQIIGICSNDSSDYPEDSFKNLQKKWNDKKYNFPYLHDSTQEVAKNFGAVCTPDIFVYKNNNSNFELFYRGRLDDSWKSEGKVKKQELKLALEDIINNKPLSNPVVPSMGCSIKWT